MKVQTIYSILLVLLVANVYICSAEPERKEICQTCRDVYEMTKKFNNRHFHFSEQQIHDEIYSFCRILPNTAEQCRVMSTQIHTFIEYQKKDILAEKTCVDLGWCHA